MNDPVGKLRVPLGVGDDNDRRSLPVQLAEQFHYFEAVCRIQVTRRLIRQNQGTVGYHCTGNSHTLLLSTG